MDLKWLEDLVSVVEKGHFSRAADARNITQSAFSRRIKSLEAWAGAELLDRSQHPVRLTPAGESFLPHAREIIRQAYQARAESTEYSRIAQTGITVACLHTLALSRIPLIVTELRKEVGPFEASIVADIRTVEEFLENLISGACDFFICYSHAAFPFNIERDAFSRIDIGSERILPYGSMTTGAVDLSADRGPELPFLEYSGTSFLSRIVQHTLEAVPARRRLKTVYRGTLAESLCTAAINGLGVGWLPETVVQSNSRSEALRCLGEQWAAPMAISVYRSNRNQRPIVNRIWQAFKGGSAAQVA